MPVTPIFAAIFSLMFAFLSANVIRHRLKSKTALGEGTDRDLLKAIRVHANFAEYVPLAIIMMWFLETITYDSRIPYALGVVLLLGRIGHVIGISYPRRFLILRQLGVLATLAVLLTCSVLLILHYIPY